MHVRSIATPHKILRMVNLLYITPIIIIRKKYVSEAERFQQSCKKGVVKTLVNNRRLVEEKERSACNRVT